MISPESSRENVPGRGATSGRKTNGLILPSRDVFLVEAALLLLDRFSCRGASSVRDTDDFFLSLALLDLLLSTDGIIVSGAPSPSPASDIIRGVS